MIILLDRRLLTQFLCVNYVVIIDAWSFYQILRNQIHKTHVDHLTKLNLFKVFIIRVVDAFEFLIVPYSRVTDGEYFVVNYYVISYKCILRYLCI